MNNVSLRAHRWLAVSLWLGVVSVAPVTAAVDSPLSENKALIQFYSANLGILAARYNLDAARAQEVIAGEIPNPQLSMDLFKLAPRSRDGLPGRSARIDQLIELGGKRRLRITAANLGIQASENDLKDAIRTLTNALRHAFYTQVLAQKNVALAADELTHLHEVEKLSALRFERGDIAESDFLRIQGQTEQAASDLDNAQADLAKARSDLALLLAWPEGAANLQVEEKWPRAGSLLIEADSASLISAALDKRPDLMAARTRIDQAREQVKLAKSQRIPDVTVGVDYQHDGENTATDSYGVGFQIALPIFNHYQGEISQATANLSNADLQALLQEKSIRAEITTDLIALQKAHTITQRFESHSLERIRVIRQAAELAYAKGATSVLDLIDAERQYKTTLHDYHSALNNETLAYYDLQQALGEGHAP